MNKPIETLEQLRERKCHIIKELGQHERRFSDMYYKFMYPIESISNFFSKKETVPATQETDNKPAFNFNTALSVISVAVKVFQIVRKFSSKSKKKH